MIKRQFAKHLYKNSQKAIDDVKAPVNQEEEDCAADKSWENNAIDKLRKNQLRVLDKFESQGEDKSNENNDDESMIDYYFAKLAYFGSNEHTFETETKLDLF